MAGDDAHRLRMASSHTASDPGKLARSGQSPCSRQATEKPASASRRAATPTEAPAPMINTSTRSAKRSTIAAMTERVLYAQSVHDEAEIGAVLSVLKAGPTAFRPGPNVKALEHKVAELYGKPVGR